MVCIFSSGQRCEIVTNYCSFVNQDDFPACKNGGTCYGLIDRYRCECALGFI